MACSHLVRVIEAPLRAHRRFSTGKNLAGSVDVAFFGSDDFSCTSLRHLLHAKSQFPGKIGTLRVITPPEKIRGKSFTKSMVPLKRLALESNLEVLDAPTSRRAQAWDEHSLLKERKRANELAVVVSFGYFLPSKLLDHFARGAINLHPSLLPRYRGSSPIESALLNNEPVTGVSVITVHPKVMDGGSILAQREVSVALEEKLSAVSDRLATVGASLVVETCLNLDAMLENAHPQDESKATQSKKLYKEQGLLRWNSLDALGVWGIFRAASASRIQPHTFFKTANGDMTKVNVLDMLVPDPQRERDYQHMLPADASPGDAFYSKKSPDFLWVKTALGDTLGHQASWVVLLKLQIEKKARPLYMKDFSNGYQLASQKLKFL